MIDAGQPAEHHRRSMSDENPDDVVEAFGAASDDFATAVYVGTTGTRATVAGQFRGTFVFPDGGGTKKFRPIGAEDSYIAIFETSDGSIV